MRIVVLWILCTVLVACAETPAGFYASRPPQAEWSRVRGDSAGGQALCAEHYATRAASSAADVRRQRRIASGVVVGTSAVVSTVLSVITAVSASQPTMPGAASGQGTVTSVSAGVAAGVSGITGAIEIFQSAFERDFSSLNTNAGTLDYFLLARSRQLSAPPDDPTSHSSSSSQADSPEARAQDEIARVLAGEYPEIRTRIRECATAVSTPSR